MEERFNKNLKARKRFVVDNALRAQASLNIVNDLYKTGGTDSETQSGVTPAARAAIEMMNKSNNSYAKKLSLSQTPAQKTVRDILNDKLETASKASAGKSDSRRML